MGLIIAYAILWVVAISFGIMALKLSFSKSQRWKRENGVLYGWSIAIPIIMTLAMTIATPVALISQYNNSIRLPEKYEQYDRAVEVSKEMLIKSDKNVSKKDLEGTINLDNLGQGLEGMKARNMIYKFIEERERIAQDIRTRRKNVFVFFKPKPINQN